MSPQGPTYRLPPQPSYPIRYYRDRVNSWLEYLRRPVPAVPSPGGHEIWDRMKADWCALQLAQTPPIERAPVEKDAPAPTKGTLRPLVFGKTESEIIKELGYE